MLIQYIKEFIQIFTNENIAEVFTEPMAVLIVFALIFGLFALFANSTTKRILLIFMLVVVGAFAIFHMASIYGFVQIPVVVGGV